MLQTTCQKWITGFATLCLISAASLAQTQTPPTDIHAGQGPINDWRNDAPGVKHLINLKDLPEPYATKSVDSGQQLAKRPDGAMPKVPDGFKVEEFLTDLRNNRLLRTAPNGDIFVAESQPGRVRIIRAKDGASKPDLNEVFASGLNQPFGIAFYPPGDDP